MPIKKLSKSEWSKYFDNMAKTIGSKNIEIDVAGLLFGNQVEVSSLPLNGITYDPKNDILEIATESVDHLIRHPKEIHTDYGIDGLHSIEVIDGDNNHQIIKFTEAIKIATTHA
jgi:hypothetical protein